MNLMPRPFLAVLPYAWKSYSGHDASLGPLGSLYLYHHPLNPEQTATKHPVIEPNKVCALHFLFYTSPRCKSSFVENKLSIKSAHCTWRRRGVHVQQCQLGAQRGDAKVATPRLLFRSSDVYTGYGEIKATFCIMDETEEREHVFMPCRGFSVGRKMISYRIWQQRFLIFPVDANV